MSTTPLRALTRANTRELLRDRTTLFGALLMPVGFIAMSVMLVALIPTAPGIDAAEMFLPFGLTMTLGAVIFFGTVSPIVDLRRRGTLRLLGTTPLPRWTFLLALVPFRALLIVVALVAVVAAAAVFDSWAPSQLPALVVTTVLGSALMLAIGFLLGAFLNSTETASTTLTVVLLAFVFAGGGVLPFELFPDRVGAVLEWLPPALFTDALANGLTGGNTTHPVWLAWIVLAGATLVVGAAALRLFRFDRSPS
ncbi:ABC transporter permease [Lipingzhangella sp. LS1_29]|uniref:ABC transporter permease n=1 Tax=Lipingzhangella rawalii TaxID=2055835 RepID=A0ABU2HAB0_9ACTN|nr:ABC transporter permease [Lipingzhangella rawalii]MDS1272264.1 ABC transporter permease [Lipingzhangella rawalii]